MAAQAGRGSWRLSPRRSGDKLLRLPTEQGSDSDPRQSEEGSSVGPPASASDSDREALIDEAVALFSSRYGRAISAEEARQMVERLTSFFSLLVEWDQTKREGLDRAA